MKRKGMELIMEEEAKERLVDEVDRYSSDDDVVALYSAYSREELERNTYIKEAEQKGIQKGFEQGISQNKIDNAKKMLELNMNIDDISKVTGLTREEIEKI